MLIRWADEGERRLYSGSTDPVGEYEMVVAIDRMSREVCASVALCRKTLSIAAPVTHRGPLREDIALRLIKCAEGQLYGQGGSFHHNYPRYSRWARPETCPVCLAEPAGDCQTTIAELEWAWVDCSPFAQGRLFGKCTVLSKAHCEHFFDLPPLATAGFIGDVQRVARALHGVTGAVKINYEIHGNSVPHLHAHLFPRYLDDDFPGAPIDYRLTEPSPYESEAEYAWFIDRLREELSRG